MKGHGTAISWKARDAAVRQRYVQNLVSPYGGVARGVARNRPISGGVDVSLAVGISGARAARPPGARDGRRHLYVFRFILFHLVVSVLHFV